MSGGSAFANASWSGCTDGVGVRADHRDERAVPVWQADREAIWDWCRWKIRVASGGAWGHITKQGNSLLRFLLVEAAQVDRAEPPGMAE